MRDRSAFDYDVSVSADKARRQRRRGMTGAFENSQRLCDHPDCDRPAQYRAPKSPSNVGEFRWFCLEHVRDYNAAWNFFADFGEEEFAAYMERERTGHRPTFRMGQARERVDPASWAHAEGRAWARFGFDDAAEALGGNATVNPGRGDGRPRPPRLPRNVVQALEILGSEPTMTRDAIRQKYRALVKELHPDMNGGDRSEEGRLRRVLWAWEQVRACKTLNGPAAG